MKHPNDNSCAAPWWLLQVKTFKFLFKIFSVFDFLAEKFKFSGGEGGIIHTIFIIIYSAIRVLRFLP